MRPALTLVLLLVLAPPAVAMPILDEVNHVWVCDPPGSACFGPAVTAAPPVTMAPPATVFVASTLVAAFDEVEGVVNLAAADDPPLAHSPEPGTILLLGSALAALGWRVRRGR